MAASHPRVARGGRNVRQSAELIKKYVRIARGADGEASLTPTTGDVLVNRYWGQYLDAVADIESVGWIECVTTGILVLLERDV